MTMTTAKQNFETADRKVNEAARRVQQATTPEEQAQASADWAHWSKQRDAAAHAMPW